MRIHPSGCISIERTNSLKSDDGICCGLFAYSIYAYHCAHGLSIRFYNPIHLCEFCYVRFICNESGVIIKRKKQKIPVSHPHVIGTVDRYWKSETWHMVFYCNNKQSQDTKKENKLYGLMRNFSYGTTREYRSESGIAIASHHVRFYLLI